MIFLFFVFSLLLINYLFFLIQISKGIKLVSKNPNLSQNTDFVSVIIPFRNEIENLPKSLSSITAQSFPPNRFEVIYIDDNSDDGSFEYLTNVDKPKNIKVLKSPISISERAHKKKALKFAIANSKGNIIITTDADCHHNLTWLGIIVAQFQENTAFVSGPVQFSSNGKLFQELQKLEFTSLILVGAGLIGIKKPIICNAANLGFRKNVFDEVGGYEDNLDLSSGDDEFLMQKIARETNYDVKFCLNKEAMSFTAPNTSINDFYQQRKRWASKGFHYTDNLIILKLIFIFLFYLSLPTQLILGIFINPLFLVSFTINLIGKFLFEYKIVMSDSRMLFPKTKLVYFILAEIFHIPYILISGIAGIFGNYKWKGREIKR